MRMMLKCAAALACAAGLAQVAQADPNNVGKVIITEIFANPAGNDDIEFIEIYNTTNEPIDISGWYLDDEDSTSGRPFPAGTIIGPRQALAVIGRVFQGVPPNDPNNPGQWLPGAHLWTPERLEQALGPGGASRFLLTDLNITIANTPTIFNEIPFLVDADGTVVDIANYQNAVNGWPAAVSGVSIQLRPQFLNHIDNDRGCAWMLSTADPFAVTSNIVDFVFEGQNPYRMCEAGNVFSPGFVSDVVPPPTDCNSNGIDDVSETCGAMATATDCNANLIPDSCEEDLNGNGVPDTCDILLDREGTDRNLNNVLDSVDINLAGGVNGRGGTLDTNNNGILDAAEDWGKVIVTEIMVDPFQSLTRTGPSVTSSLEWVEIKNVSAGPVDISGYRLLDIETGGDGYTSPVPAGTVLAAGEVAVLCQLPNFEVSSGGPLHTAETARALYEALWGATTPGGQPIRWIPLSRWGARATNSTLTTEVLALVAGAVINDAVVPANQSTVTGPHPTRLNGPGGIGAWVTDRGYIVDVANYSNANSNNEPLNGWPGSEGHSSFYLKAGSQTVTGNNPGPNWALSIGGLNGARQSTRLTGAGAPFGLTNSGEDFGSPGFVPDSHAVPSGDVIISEIAATTAGVFPGSNPLPPQGQSVAGGRDEWVEIVNTTAGVIDLSGWYLQDEDGRTTGFPAGTVLQPGEAAVVIGVDTFVPSGTNQPDLQPLDGTDFVQEFYDAWGCGYTVIPVREWYTDNGPMGLVRLADNPSFTNEYLRLMRADGSVADITRYDDDDTPTAVAVFPFGWPGDAVAGIDVYWSIYVLPGFYDQGSNDDGRNWAASLTGFEGGRQSVVSTAVNGSGYPTGIWNRSMFGSPGFVDGLTLGTVIIPPGGACVQCAPDYNGDGNLDPDDLADYIGCYFSAPPCDRADYNGDGNPDPDDLADFIAAYFAGCP
ncbi:MAG: lamin tail domain-containing protein [Phycisphaerae bacterium]|nr:lamin tail domain-containing protein [Phycisphaerae bacterium]